MDESDANPPRRVGTSGTRRLCTHAAIASHTRPPRAFGPATSSSTIPSLHLYMAYAAQTRSGKPDARMTGRCDFSSLAYHIAGISWRGSKNESKGRGKNDAGLSDAAIGDRSSIATGLHRNEAFLPLAAEQEARPKHERGGYRGTGGTAGGFDQLLMREVSLQRETGVESEGAVRGAERGAEGRHEGKEHIWHMWKRTLGGFEAEGLCGVGIGIDRRRSNRGDGKEAVGRRGRETAGLEKRRKGDG
ncbi:predicted protein [Histoplasma mississippiense (nom. inval.)]|uniref:predicted protein n=1 Tax=Ajellomyces capsulatus (strain NAm1 / WU24) TaxID=2059318 RepID=UPI000157D0ED|nr:predicted protein [Histoplasma mississippiense (nom. inval.)]EDN11072.1 predicted protein [Histoplasma mississippiense (nom. inval.)]